ncbi:hypothetical protein MW887_003164 [Aspergillus wentii]|nr:hypothetical protein MW887_003164 [Aspergillus wentii]
MPDESTSTAPKGKRTNSLAFCQTDCHTCSSTGQRCNRQRPQCSTCLSQGRKCGGFVTPLLWDNRRMWTNDGPARQQRKAGQTSTAASASSDLKRRFRFVSGPSRARRRRRACASEDAVQRSAEEALPDVTVDDVVQLPNTDKTSYLDDLGTDAFFLDETGLFDTGQPPLLDLGQDVLDLMASSKTPNNGFDRDQPDPLSHDLDFLGDSLQSNTENLNASRIEEINLSSPQLAGALELSDVMTNEHDGLLEMYDSEFCVLPLTSDTTINPFRCQRQTSQGSRLLFHSILALCCQHLDRLTGSWSSEASKHRTTASQLLEVALQGGQARNGVHLLEPILIMFTLDCTLSAAGKWTSHLAHAHSILQACGGPSALKNARVRAQVGMLLWWDATLALVSRQGPIIDQAYLKFLVKWEEQDEWSFFDLTGCPGELLVHLFHLAELAKQKEMSCTMEWLTFNMTPIIAIEQKIMNWTNNHVLPSNDTDTDSEETFHAHQDRHHCAEAWRYTLLIYIERVFKWERQQHRPRCMPRLVRMTLDHVRSCRRTSQTQKQLLLPVFLAGSETADKDMQGFVKDYCRYWGEKIR